MRPQPVPALESFDTLLVDLRHVKQARNAFHHLSQTPVALLVFGGRLPIFSVSNGSLQILR